MELQGAADKAEFLMNRAREWAYRITSNDQKQAALVTSYMDAAVRLLTREA
jgi:hypothetical protein